MSIVYYSCRSFRLCGCGVSRQHPIEKLTYRGDFFGVNPLRKHHNIALLHSYYCTVVIINHNKQT